MNPNLWWRFRKHSHDRKGSWKVWHIASKSGEPICHTSISKYAAFGWDEEWADLNKLPEKGKVCRACKTRWMGDVTRGVIRQGELEHGR